MLFLVNNARRCHSSNLIPKSKSSSIIVVRHTPLFPMWRVTALGLFISTEFLILLNGFRSAFMRTLNWHLGSTTIAYNQRATNEENIFVHHFVFSLTEAAGDQADGETAMKNLESARVQMVEKIKSISDFIEKEIENENNKKVNKCKNLFDVYYN